MNRELNGLKLRALVRDHLASDNGDRADVANAVEISEPADIGVGAAVLVGSDAWVLVEDRHERALGVGLAWMQKSRAQTLNVLTGESAGVLARRAANFAIDVEVWEVIDRALSRAVPKNHVPEIEPRASHLEFGSMILDCGADVVIEHGVVSGEVVGLEVCRVVDDESTGEPRLEIGVGVHDREAFALLHGQTPLEDSLKRIVDVVRHHRRVGADPHPLNRLAAERALRSRIISDPSKIGVVSLRAVATASPRVNLKDSSPCAALGETENGDPLVAVFSTGIDLDVVPVSADTRAWLGSSDAHLVIVVPERDASPITQRLAGALHRPATLIGVSDDVA
ncbi:MAG: hypothetical protein ACKOI2_07765 [Actinomycetota bacterium]